MIITIYYWFYTNYWSLFFLEIILLSPILKFSHPSLFPLSLPPLILIYFGGGLYSMKSGFYCRFLYNGITIRLLYFGFEYHKRNHDSVVCFGKTHNGISISLCVPTKVILLWFLGKPITGSWFRFGYISFFYFVIIFNN